MNTGINIMDIDPAGVQIQARQFPAPGPFGTVEISLGGVEVKFFAQGPDAARDLLTAIRTQAAVDIDMRST